MQIGELVRIKDNFAYRDYAGQLAIYIGKLGCNPDKYPHSVRVISTGEQLNVTLDEVETADV